jgi:hypothetical protein
MSVNLDNRLVAEPIVEGVTRTGAPSWFAPHDEAPMGYWKKPTDGTVFLAQYGENGLDHKLKRNFTRLHQYGEFASAGTRTWDPMLDPFYPLVMKGGLRELPPEQIKELGWHRVPSRDAKASHRAVEQLIQRVQTERSLSRDEALLAVMPQLKDFDLTDWPCVSHPGRLFPTEAAKISHDSVMHKEAIQSESIGRAVAVANANANANASSDPLLALIAQQGELIAEMKSKIEVLEGAKAPKGKAVQGQSRPSHDPKEPAAD